jgi:hypothetical protein
MFSLAPFEGEMTLLILLATPTPTGGIPSEFACPRGGGEDVGPRPTSPAGVYAKEAR